MNQVKIVRFFVPRSPEWIGSFLLLLKASPVPNASPILKFSRREKDAALPPSVFSRSANLPL